MKVQLAIGVFVFTAIANSAVCQAQPPNSPQAVAYATQSIAALTGGTTISDVMLSGTAVWAGSDTGSVTFKALGISESRMDSGLTGGTATEIRDSQTGPAKGQWIAPDNSSGLLASQNC